MQHQQAIEDEWLYEFIIQYMESPMWKTPIQDFMDKKCAVFENEENQEEIKKVQEEYVELVEGLQNNLRNEVGIDQEKYKDMLKVGVRIQGYGAYFQELLVISDKEIFKTKMLNRNKELEYQAFMMMSDDQSPQELMRLELEKQERDLDLALEMSLKIDQEKKGSNSNEDQEMLDAIANSMQTFDLEKEKQTIENQEVNQQLIKSLPPLKKKRLDPMSVDQLQAEKIALKIKMEKINFQSEQPPKQSDNEMKEKISQEELMKERKERLIQQKNLILKQKEEQRNKEAQNYKSLETVVPKGTTNISKEELERRKAIMQKIKDQL